MTRTKQVFISSPSVQVQEQHLIERDLISDSQTSDSDYVTLTLGAGTPDEHLTKLPLGVVKDIRRRTTIQTAEKVPTQNPYVLSPAGFTASVAMLPPRMVGKMITDRNLSIQLLVVDPTTQPNRDAIHHLDIDVVLNDDFSESDKEQEEEDDPRSFPDMFEAPPPRTRRPSTQVHRRINRHIRSNKLPRTKYTARKTPRTKQTAKRAYIGEHEPHRIQQVMVPDGNRTMSLERPVTWFPVQFEINGYPTVLYQNPRNESEFSTVPRQT
jgi:hypothetical protein